MAFMAIGDDEVTTCNSQLNSDDESDEDVNSFIERLHDSLKESCARNKQLKQKINFLIQDNTNLFRQNKNLKDENDHLKKNETVRTRIFLTYNSIFMTYLNIYSPVLSKYFISIFLDPIIWIYDLLIFLK